MKMIKYYMTFFCCFLFSMSYAQIDVSQIDIEKKYNGNFFNIERKSDYTEKTVIHPKQKDTITFVFDNLKRIKVIIVKNSQNGISNQQFHKYAVEMNPKFYFHSKVETQKAIIYFNEKKDLVNVKVFSDNEKNKLTELMFISDKKMISLFLSNLN